MVFRNATSVKERRREEAAWLIMGDCKACVESPESGTYPALSCSMVFLRGSSFFFSHGALVMCI